MRAVGALALTLMALSLVLPACAPTMRQTLTLETADYTQCDHVEIECVDEDCSNLQGGPWMATACGTRYRCSRTNDEVTCVPTAS